MEATRHKIMDNAVQLFMRPNSPSWWCSCTVNGARQRKSTGEESLARAKDVARDWYVALLSKIVVAKVGQDATPGAGSAKQLGQYLAGELKDIGRKRNSVRPEGKTFAEAAEVWRRQYRALTLGERSPDYVDLLFARLDKHVLPFFGSMPVTGVIRSTTRDYLIHRTQPALDERGNIILDKRTAQPWRPARSTLNQEMVVVRHVMETANGEGWLPSVPKLSFPYKASGKIGHRAWFTHDEYVALYKRTGQRAKNPPHEFGRWKTENEDLHDYVLFMTNTGLRPDEGALIEPRDVEIVFDVETGENILEIAVRGKRGTGWCKSMPGAVLPYKRIVERHKFGRMDKIFPKPFRELFTRVLNELGLKFDREGNRRTPYSLRHTYICLRLLDGADIYQVAKNCRTSVQMIQDHYAIHLKDMIDAAAINRRKSKSASAKPKDNAAAKRANESAEFIGESV